MQLYLLMDNAELPVQRVPLPHATLKRSPRIANVDDQGALLAGVGSHDPSATLLQPRHAGRWGG